MIGFIAGALLLSLDSFVVSAALGTSGVRRRASNRIACAFGVCDGVASALGLWFGASLATKLELADWAGPILVGIYGAIILMTAQLSRTAVDRQADIRRVLFLFPFVMSLDNLGGALFMPASCPPIAQVAGIALVSGLMSWCGFRSGELASARVYRVCRLRTGSPILGGLTLLFASLLLAIT